MKDIKIDYEDDKKCKYQSVTATSSHDDYSEMGSFGFSLIAYGSDELEARENLLKEVLALSEMVNLIKLELEG